MYRRGRFREQHRLRDPGHHPGLGLSRVNIYSKIYEARLTWEHGMRGIPGKSELSLPPCWDRSPVQKRPLLDFGRLAVDILISWETGDETHIG